MHQETGVDQDAILAYLSDGTRLRTDNVRELVGAHDQASSPLMSNNGTAQRLVRTDYLRFQQVLSGFRLERCAPRVEGQPTTTTSDRRCATRTVFSTFWHLTSNRVALRNTPIPSLATRCILPAHRTYTPRAHRPHSRHAPPPTPSGPNRMQQPRTKRSLYI